MASVVPFRPGAATSFAAFATAMLLFGATTPAASAAGSGSRWNFEETSGTVAMDSSGLANHGTIHAASLGAAGYEGKAFAFSARNPWVEVPDAASLNPGTRDFSFSAWVNFSTAPGSGETYDIVRKGLSTTSGGEFKLEITPGARPKCLAKDSTRLRGVAKAPTRVNLADGSWHNVGCRLTGSTWQVVVDGTVQRSSTVAFGSISNTKSLSIGSKYGLEDGLPGRIDSVQVNIG